MAKRIILFCTLISILDTLWAQIPVLQVVTHNSGTVQFQVTKIDSIVFSSAADYLYINYDDDKQRTFATAEIDLLQYGIVNTQQDVSIVWNENEVTITNPMANDGVCVTAEGADVLISSTYPGEINYNLSGNSTNGSLKIYSDYKYQLTLLGLTLTNPQGAAINSQCKKKGTIKLQKGYINTLTDGKTYTYVGEEDEKGCFFSEGQLIFKGAGTLNIVARGKHGIASDDYLEVENGCINITTTANAAKAMKANDYILIMGGTIDITQSGSKVVENNDYSYCAALKSDSTIEMTAGSLTIHSSAEGGRGLSADMGIFIRGGAMTISMTGNGSVGSSGNNPFGGGGGSGGPGGGPGGGWGGSTTTTSDSFTCPCIKTDGYVTISGGTMDFTTTGIKGFGIKAYGIVTFTGGTFMVHTSGTQAEGIESKTAINLQGGHILSISEKDDAINCAGKITCSGAWVYAVSNGNDAIDSNYGRSGAITISGGVVVALSAAGSPEEGVDCDNNNYITIQGGYVFTGGSAQGGGGGGWGGSSSGASVGSASQGYCFTGSYAITKNNYYTIKNASGETLFSIKALTSISSSKNSLSLISAPTLTKKSSNTIYAGTSVPTGDSQWDEYIYVGGSSPNTTNIKTFTAK